MLQEPKEIMFWFFRNNQLIVRSLSIALQHHTVIDSVFVVSFTAMEDHYRATTIEDDASITAHYEASERRFVDLHFLLPCKFVRRIPGMGSSRMHFLTDFMAASPNFL